MLDQLQGLRVFCKVAETGSFTAASERMSISTAAATKHLQQLEQRLGVRLLHRTSRRVSLTEMGRAYLESIQAILQDLDEADLSVTREAQMPAGRLRLTAPSWFSIPRFGDILARFRQHYPLVELDLDLSDRTVDIVDEGLDLALRVSSALQTALLSRTLCPIRFHLVASPNLVTRPLQHPTSLQSFPWLEYNYHPTEGRLQFGPTQVRLQTVLRSNSTTLIHHAARSAVGIAVLPAWLVEDDLASGQLVELFPAQQRREATLYAVCSSRRYLSARVQVFLNLVAHTIGGGGAAAASGDQGVES